MDMLSLIAEWIDRLTPLLSMLFAGIAWLIGVFQSRVLGRKKKKRSDELLGMKPDVDCEVIVPIRYGKLRQKLAGGIEYEMSISYDYVTVDECLAVSEISRLLGPCNLRIIQPRTGMDERNNKFCLGSILSNDYTIDLFHGKTGVHLAGRFARASGEATLNHPGMKAINDLVVQRQDQHMLVFYGGSAEDVIEYPYDPMGDYVVWVKLRAPDYLTEQHGTVHFIFGDKSATATNAIRFISTHREDLYRILKKNKHLDHHFIVMRCSSTNEFDISSLLDITDRMLIRQKG